MASKRGNGEGSIYQRESDGKWCSALKLGNGKRKVIYGRTRQEVAKKLRAAQENVDKGLPPTSMRQTLRSFLSQWLEDSVKSTVRPRTYQSYRQLVENHIAPSLGTIQLALLTPHDVQIWLNGKHAGGLSARTCQYLRAVLRRSLNQAMRWGLVHRNVASLADPPKGNAREISPLSPKEALAFLTVVKGDRLEALYVLAVSTGLRQGELLGLRWGDIDLNGGTLRVRRQCQRIGGKLVLTDLKTQKSQRTVALPSVAWTALKEHRIRQLEERLAAGDRWSDQDLLFASTVGGCIEATNLVKQYKAHLQRAELPPLRFHDLRHSAATFLLLQGMADRTVMEILGHTSLAMTSRYMHVLDGLKREAANQMDALLTGTGE